MYTASRVLRINNGKDAHRSHAVALIAIFGVRGGDSWWLLRVACTYTLGSVLSVCSTLVLVRSFLMYCFPMKPFTRDQFE